MAYKHTYPLLDNCNTSFSQYKQQLTKGFWKRNFYYNGWRMRLHRNKSKPIFRAITNDREFYRLQIYMRNCYLQVFNQILKE